VIRFARFGGLEALLEQSTLDQSLENLFWVELKGHVNDEDEEFLPQVVGDNDLVSVHQIHNGDLPERTFVPLQFAQFVFLPRSSSHFSLVVFHSFLGGYSSLVESPQEPP
jgi:hypothetical protein